MADNSSRNVSQRAEISTERSSLSEIYFRAYSCVDQGLWFDENGLPDVAVGLYEGALELIDKAGNMPGATENENYLKMLSARGMVVDRLQWLRSRCNGEEKSQTADVEPPVCFLEAFEPCRDAELICQIDDGVQLFYILGDEATIPSYPTKLQIFKYTKPPQSESESELKTVGFISVGSWVYPLLPGKSPVLHSTFGAYIFPSCSEDPTDPKVGLMLPPNLDKEKLKQFEDIVHESTMCVDQKEPPKLTETEEKSLSAKIANFLVSGGTYVALGIRECAEKTSDIIERKSSLLSSRVSFSESKLAGYPRVQTGVHYLRKGSKLAVKVSGYLADQVGVAASRLGKLLASEASKRMKKDGVVSKAVYGAAEVASGGICGAAAVWVSMEEAARILGKSIANGSVRVMEQKYGPSVATLTDDALHTLGYCGATAWNVHNIGPKAIAKETVRELGLSLSKEGSSRNLKMKKPSPPQMEIVEIEDKKKEKKKKLQQESDFTLDESTEPGIIYMSTIPYSMTVKQVRDILESYGTIGRIYFHKEQVEGKNGKRRRRYTEGWVEFADKRVAKRVAMMLNNKQVGGRKRSRAYECLWNMKYLHRFKWYHLTEQLTYERNLHRQRLQMEVSQAKREARFFSQQLEKGKHLSKLEQHVLKKGGLWERYQRQIKQRKPFVEKKSVDRTKLLKSILQ
ncbi:Activator of basal transcription 1 [Trichinella pseudospiralis]|uniref:Activator of basal transcription 1 n=2 Tax=Trichinella pseudospiralis TaxID=6337 RepID=A0A0V1H3H1_TRIPS|nr:Activator of basal transcription 1 [Trichinella pseudospiralis]